MRESSKKVRRIALSAMLTALGVVILYLGCFFETIDLTMAALASLCIVLAMIELGIKYASLIYLATALLAILLLPSKLIAAEYALFAGIYPLIKSAAERLRTVSGWAVKLIFANFSMTLIVIVSKFLFSLPIAYGWLLAATYLLVNVVTVLFDIALTKLITLYYLRLQARFAGLFRGMK